MESSELQETFDRFDRDNNGRIDFAEFQELLSALNAEMDDPTAQVGFESIDSDGNGTIDFDEFAAWWNEQ